MKNQHAELCFYSVSSLISLKVDKHVAGHIILTLNQPICFSLTSHCYLHVLCGKVKNFNFKVKSLMLELTENVEPTIFLTLVEHANHYTIKVVLYANIYRYNSLW